MHHSSILHLLLSFTMCQFYSLSLVEFHNVPVLYFISFVATPLWSLAASDLAAPSKILFLFHVFWSLIKVLVADKGFGR